MSEQYVANTSCKSTFTLRHAYVHVSVRVAVPSDETRTRHRRQHRTAPATDPSSRSISTDGSPDLAHCSCARHGEGMERIRSIGLLSSGDLPGLVSRQSFPPSKAVRTVATGESSRRPACLASPSRAGGDGTRHAPVRSNKEVTRRPFALHRQTLGLGLGPRRLVTSSCLMAMWWVDAAGRRVAGPRVAVGPRCRRPPRHGLQRPGAPLTILPLPPSSYSRLLPRATAGAGYFVQAACTRRAYASDGRSKALASQTWSPGGQDGDEGFCHLCQSFKKMTEHDYYLVRTKNFY